MEFGSYHIRTKLSSLIRDVFIETDGILFSKNHFSKKSFGAMVSAKLFSGLDLSTSDIYPMVLLQFVLVSNVFVRRIYCES